MSAVGAQHGVCGFPGSYGHGLGAGWGRSGMWGSGGAQLGARKRCWEEEDGSNNGGRLVRQRAAGGEHGGLQGITHGASAASNSALQVHGTSHYQQHQHQQPSQPQPQHQNAFHVLMSASPIKVDGIVCRRSSKTVSQ